MYLKNTLIFIAATVLVVFTFQSCTKEEVAKSVSTFYDNRDSIEGDFTGTLITTSAGIPQSGSKTVTVTKGENGKLIFAIGTDITINTDVAIGTKSSLTGSILQQDVTYKGSTATAIGSGVVGQHFVYTSQLNKLTFGITVTEGSSTKTLVFTGNK
ncbi:MAG: hypothetical protein KBE91_05860 [Bacteroidia bacterium]|nr:hypothetical protein [Bacteroidia bacterium]MBP9689118.1 hypothetical protein [Bacteroidia bacterium]